MVIMSAVSEHSWVLDFSQFAQFAKMIVGSTNEQKKSIAEFDLLCEDVAYRSYNIFCL